METSLRCGMGKSPTTETYGKQETLQNSRRFSKVFRHRFLTILHLFKEQQVCNAGPDDHSVDRKVSMVSIHSNLDQRKMEETFLN